MDYAYTTTRGAVQVVPASIHKMIQRGMRFGHAHGELNKTCKFVAGGKAEVVAKVAPKAKAVPATKAKAKKVTKPARKAPMTTAKPVKVAGAKSNAELMREHIAVIKANNGTVEDAIAYGINELKQSKSQAQIYAKNNWNKA
jgi:hypothetical protein